MPRVEALDAPALFAFRTGGKRLSRAEDIPVVESRIFEWIPDGATATPGPEHLDPEYVETYDLKTGPEPADDVNLLRGLGLDETST